MYCCYAVVGSFLRWVVGYNLVFSFQICFVGGNSDSRIHTVANRSSLLQKRSCFGDGCYRRGRESEFAPTEEYQVYKGVHHANTVLTTTYYDAVRALIAPDITEVHISDAYLSQLPFAPAAEKQIRQKLESEGIDIGTFTEESLEDARLAMMHACAGVLCLTAPQLLRQSALQVSTEVQRIDWQTKREFHLSEVDRRINDIIARVGDKAPPKSRTRLNPFRAIGGGV